MKKVLIVLTVIGTVLPNIFVLKESFESGNYLLYAAPLDTFRDMFATNASSAFIIDLLFIVLLFLWWSYKEAKSLEIKNVWIFWVYTFALGIAGGLPLFLYFRQRRLEDQ
jgi:hypothetical protein